MGEDEDNPSGEKLGGNTNSDKDITDLLLGVVNWWCLKHGENEVVQLIMRHFEHGPVYSSCVNLAAVCGLAKPGNHRDTPIRQALEPCAMDLAKMMKGLVNSKRVPNILIPASELGKVPLDALSLNNERSVSARLDSLESSVKSVVSAVEKLTAVKTPSCSLAPMPEMTVTPAPALPSHAAQVTSDQTFANVAARMLHPGTVGGGQSGQGLRGAGGPGQASHSQRVRSRSPQVKRGSDGNVAPENEDTGFRRQGRPRHQTRQAAAGASTVVVEDVGELQPSLQYYIGNTPGKATEEVIRKVLEKCAVPLLDDSRGNLVIESVHCLTKDTDPRTKCWRVVVPPGFKDIMENTMLYPQGWKFREFVGIFRNPRATKKIRLADNNVVDQVMAEVSQSPNQGDAQLLHSLQEQVKQLVQQQGGVFGEAVSGQSLQPGQG